MRFTRPGASKDAVGAGGKREDSVNKLGGNNDNDPGLCRWLERGQ